MELPTPILDFVYLDENTVWLSENKPNRDSLFSQDLFLGTGSRDNNFFPELSPEENQADNLDLISTINLNLPTENSLDSLTGEGNNLEQITPATSSETRTLQYRQNQLRLQILEAGVLVEEAVGKQNQPLPELERIKIKAEDSLDRRLPPVDKTYLDRGEGIGIKDGDDGNSSLKKRIEKDEAIEITIEPTENYNSSQTAEVKVSQVKSIATGSEGGSIKISAYQRETLVGELTQTVTTKNAEISFTSLLPFDQLKLSAGDEDTKFTFRSVSLEVSQQVLDAPDNPPPQFTHLRYAQDQLNLLVFEDGVLVEQSRGGQNQSLPELERIKVLAIDSDDNNRILADKTFLDRGEGIGIKDGDDGNSSLKKRIDGDEKLLVQFQETSLYQDAQQAFIEVNKVKSISSGVNGGKIKIEAVKEGEIVDSIIYELDSLKSQLNFQSTQPFDSLYLSAGDNDTKFTFRLLDLWAINRVSNQPSQLQVHLANDTGVSNSDSITNNATITGIISDVDGLSSVIVNFVGSEQAVDIINDINADGSFSLDESKLQQIRGDILVDGDYQIDFTATDSLNNISNTSVNFSYDTTTPELELITPIATGIHSSNIPIMGNSNEEVEVKVVIDDGTPIIFSSNGESDENGSDNSNNNENDRLWGFFQDLTNQSVGNHIAEVMITDKAGNSETRTIYYSVGDNIIVKPDNSNGWGVKTDNDIVLGESDSYVNQTTIPIELGLETNDGGEYIGSRTLSFDVNTIWDNSDSNSLSKDRLLVYLLDSNNQTILDNGIDGSPIIAISEDNAQYPSGLVTFNGQKVNIDLTGFKTADSASLVFQLVNQDSDVNSVMSIDNITNTTDINGVEKPVFPINHNIVAVGEETDLNNLNSNANIEVVLENVHIDIDNGEYNAQLSLINNGDAIGRNVVVVIKDLPAEVQLLNASGVDGNGNPYLNLRNAINNGGLDAGGMSASVTLDFANPNHQLFSIVTEVLTGEANVAPNFQTISPLSVMPGEKLTVPLIATDGDGDNVTFSVEDIDNLPNGMLTGDGQLVFTPTPNDVGSYTITVNATDNASTTQQDITLNVVEEIDGITTISGIILDTNGTPLAGIPIELSRITTLTNSDGSFTLEIPPELLPTESFDINVPQGDIHFDPFNTGGETIEMRRAGFDTTTGTSINNPRRHPNLVSGFLDGSAVYGSDEHRANALRTLDGTGQLKTSPGNLLPFNNLDYFPEGMLENDSAGNVDSQSLFVAGDVRASENPALASLHTLLMREHNALAVQIANDNPTFTGEEIYQQARKLVIALMQKITYDEYLPLLLGSPLSAYDGYDDTINPMASTLFNTTAFRIGHSQSTAEIITIDQQGNTNELLSQRSFFNTAPIVNNGIDSILRGLAQQQAQLVDTKVIGELRNFLFGPPGAGGLDLVSLGIQRGRDLGLPSYNQVRIDMGLTPVSSFAEITSDVEVQQALADTYGTVDEVDAWVGGLAEDHVAGGMVGSLFATIIADQFTRLRDGDRFWYENGQLTTEELTWVENTTLASLIERNTNITDLPDWVLTTNQLATVSPDDGLAITGNGTDIRSYDGQGNNLNDSSLGSKGENLRIEGTVDYGDGISSPAGESRPSARVVSNSIFAQDEDILSGGATVMGVFWGQLIAHDLSLTPTGISNTLEIHGDDVEIPGVSYPFVAEKLPLVLGHDVYGGYDNVIARPIYLPALDVDNGVTIDPNITTIVTTNNIPYGSVVVEAGTLKQSNGAMFTEELSITEVPTDLTPAALPDNLSPDLVVTIQPAEMVFTQPAPLSLPNLSGWVPGLEMDLYSINPNTGDFDVVGKGVVSEDGTTVETVTGGIRNSSWHFWAPQPLPISNNSSSNGCNQCQQQGGFNSEVEFDSGAIIETHDLVTYQSNGEIRGITLTYHSLRADASPILSLNFEDINLSNFTRNTNDVYLVSDLTIEGNNFEYQVPGYDGDEFGLDGGEHFWSIPNQRGDVYASLQPDLQTLPTGKYNYRFNSGFLNFNGTRFTGTSAVLEDELLHVNHSDSDFGSGWNIAGWQEIIENSDGSLLLVDGDGEELFFDTTINGNYVNPPGDFSVVEKLPDGIFRRTMKDKTVYQFNQDNKLASMTDSNGNQTSYVYQGDGKLEKIIDPIGLETVFTYNAQGKVEKITDPANRETLLFYDDHGNLIRVQDPDKSERQWDYDDDHHIIRETDANGQTEQAFYDQFGRATSARLKDGTTVEITPIQVQKGLYAKQKTIDPFSAPEVLITNEPITASYRDSNGNVLSTQLDLAGQLIESSDGGGSNGNTQRNENNLIQTQTNARGFETEYTYDAQGNVETITTPSPVYTSNVIGNSNDRLVINNNDETREFGKSVSNAGDINGDGVDDIIIGSPNRNQFSGDAGKSYVVFGISNGFNLNFDVSNLDGSNGFVINGDNSSFGYSVSSAGDINGDGFDDVVIGAPYADYYTGKSYVVFGSGNDFASSLDVSSLDGNNGFVVNSMTDGDELGSSVSDAGDINDDGFDDIIIGAPMADLEGSGYGYEGQSFVIFGTDDGFNSSFDLSSLDGSNGFVVNGDSGDELGSSVSSAGDINGDGFDDVVIGASYADYYTGKSYVVFGSGNDFAYSLDVSSLDGNNGFVVNGDSNRGELGSSVSDAGDINDDGFDDIIIGAPMADLEGSGYGYEGQSFVIFGTDDGFNSSFDLSSLDGSNGFVVNGDSGDELGRSVSSAGDINGDGFDDVVIGAPYADYYTGKSYVVFGNGNDFASSLDVSSLDGNNGFVVNGDSGEGLGSSVSSAGDLNDDGFDDIIIGRSFHRSNGESYVIFGVDESGIELSNELSTSVQTYTYEPIFNQVATTTDELGRITVYDYDDYTGDLLSTTRVVGEIGGDDDVTTIYTYTVQGLTDTLTDANGRVTDYDYDFNGNLEKVIYAQGTSEQATIQYEYDLAGNQTAMIDENGNRTEYEYDGGNRLIKTTYAVGTPDEAVEINAYDGNGNLILTTDGNGNITRYEYDEIDRLIKTIEADPDGDGPLTNPITTNTYDGNGNLISTIDPVRRETKYIYDSRDRLIETILPDNTVTSSNYDSNNNLINSTNQVGDGSKRIYDSRERLFQEKDAQGNKTTYVYDEANQLITVVDGENNRTEYEYDDLGRQIAVIQVDTVNNAEYITRTEYDKVGNVVATIDPNGNRTEYEYDNRDRQILMRNVVDGGDDIITRTEYDDVGNVLSVIDAENNTTAYVYDARNRLVTETNELGFDRIMTYDDANNQTSVTDRNDRVRTFSYDGLNRQVKEIWLDDNSLPIYSTTSSYNSADELIYITNPDATYSYTYDEMGRMETIDNAGTPDVANVILTYDYDEKGNIISVIDTINGVASGLTTYEYDKIDRLISLTQSGNGVEDKRVDFDYNGIGQYERIDRFADLTGNNLVVSSSYDYDGANRLTNLTHNNGTTDVAFYDLTYDTGSRITQIVDIDGTSSFAYDTRNQLLEANHSDIDDESYSYDDNGNRTLSGYVTGVNNELLSDGVYNYDYDNEGNLISQTSIATGEVRLFEWDYLNRLVAVTDFDSDNNVLQTVEFSYDMFGQRLSKLVDGVATYFVYDRDDVILDFVDDGSGIELDMRYLHGNQVDEVLAQEDGNGDVVWLLRDYLGTIRDLVDNTGDVVNHLTYDSYGNVVSETDATVDSRYRFTGREWDEEIDLYYYRARYYSGETGRFISVDPISFDSGTYNLYGYVDNNPVSNSDPLGQFKVELRYRLVTPSGFFIPPSIIVTIPPLYHADIVVSDKNGKRAYWAGPKNALFKFGPPWIGTSIAFFREINYDSNFKFFVGDKRFIQEVYNDGTDCPNQQIEDKIISEFGNIQTANIEYIAKGPNSNSSAFHVLSTIPEIGARPAPPSNITVPGWRLNPYNFPQFNPPNIPYGSGLTIP
ncbi:peroxidase family protein [Cyanobacterium aponinum UTEX 3222]|uniref:peroxidase family protein n=2 Tax=Cyanobacterium aponinum TaxID=379064 RepID=UPI00308CB51B|nr:peroxidase family protein [Cyanobacterium aponinum UTEX 3222]